MFNIVKYGYISDSWILYRGNHIKSVVLNTTGDDKPVFQLNILRTTSFQNIIWFS